MTKKDQQLYEKIYGLLGLAMRAGQVISGQEVCINGVRKKELKLVLLDESVAENSFKKISETCERYRCPLYLIPTGKIGKAIGKENRTVVGLQPGTLLDKICKKTQQMENKISWHKNDNNSLMGGLV